MEKPPTPPLKSIFSSVFSGEKKRTIKTKQVEEKSLKAESGTVAALGELVQQSNEISKVVVEAQNQQNYLLVELLKSIDGLKESGGLGGTVGASILSALAELTKLLMPAILGGTLAHFLDADESKPGNSIIGNWINENIPGAKTVDNFIAEGNPWKMLAYFNSDEMIAHKAPFVWALNPDDKNTKKYASYLSAHQIGRAHV